VTQEIQRSLSNHSLIKGYGAEEFHNDRIAEELAKSLRTRLRVALTGAWMRLSTGMVTVLGPVLVFWYGAHEFVNGRLSIGALFAFNTYLAYIMGATNGLLSINVTWQSLKVALTRIFSLLEEGRASDSTANATVILPMPKGHLRCSKVSFSYPKCPPALLDVSFDIQAGACVGITGPSGVGKSTILSLLLRLYDPDCGQVLLDGVDIRSVDPRQLRRVVCVVPQEPCLISGTVMQNIRYNATASDAEVRTAAAVARAWAMARSYSRDQ
jgi:ABC-type bacteriocin/lantibiotic exporter with double-glycine peptidase domain